MSAIPDDPRDPASPAAHINLGNVLADLNQGEEAVESYHTAIELLDAPGVVSDAMPEERFTAFYNLATAMHALAGPPPRPARAAASGLRVTCRPPLASLAGQVDPNPASARAVGSPLAKTAAGPALDGTLHAPLVQQQLRVLLQALPLEEVTHRLRPVLRRVLALAVPGAPAVHRHRRQVVRQALHSAAASLAFAPAHSAGARRGERGSVGAQATSVGRLSTAG